MHVIKLDGYNATVDNGEKLELGTFGSYGEEQLQIVKAPDWENLSVIATFNSPNKKSVQVVNSVTGVIKVPKEATADLYGVGTIVFVGLADGVQRISADVEYIVRKHSNISGTEPAEPTPDLLQQVLTLSKDAQVAAKNAEQSAKNAMKDATDTVKPYKEEAVQAAAGAALSEKNAAESKAAAQEAAERATQAGIAASNAAGEAERSAGIAAGAAGDSALNAVNAQKSAQNAQQSAKNAAESQSAAAASADAVKQQVENITPDDSSIGDKPWSSKNIVDMLCPPLEESGNPVVCYPVAGYPLGVKAKWEPVQEGSGTPSPENIRPIKGRDSVTVERKEDGLTRHLTFSSTINGGEVDAVSGEVAETWGLVTLDGAEKWTVSGKLLDNKTDWYYVSSKIPNAVNAAPQKNNEICSHYPHADVANTNTVQGCAIVWGCIRVRWGDTIPDDADAWKAYLAAQYAAGTPVQIAYKLAKPVSFTATGAQPIPALAGANTLLTDADSATVTGRADPIKRITDLEDAVASQT